MSQFAIADVIVMLVLAVLVIGAFYVIFVEVKRDPAAPLADGATPFEMGWDNPVTMSNCVFQGATIHSAMSFRPSLDLQPPVATLVDGAELPNRPQQTYDYANALVTSELNATKAVTAAPPSANIAPWNETNAQKALIMALHGTPEQREQARQYFNQHLQKGQRSDG